MAVSDVTGTSSDIRDKLLGQFADHHGKLDSGDRATMQAWEKALAESGGTHTKEDAALDKAFQDGHFSSQDKADVESAAKSDAAGSGDAIGGDLRQQNIGDCVGVSSLKAFSNTPTGESILKQSVKANADGSYDVTFKGEPGKTYNISSDDLQKYGAGDDPAAAIIAAAYQHFGKNPDKDSLPTDDTMKLLAGDEGTHTKFQDSSASQQDIENYLKTLAPDVGPNKDTAVVFGGKPQDDGSWSKGDGHAFCMTDIDEDKGTITYTDPWDDNKERTMSISDFAKQAAGTSADIETQDFTKNPSTSDSDPSATNSGSNLQGGMSMQSNSGAQPGASATSLASILGNI